MAYNTMKGAAVSHIDFPMRKRTEKACDQCRRRKIKCDGSSKCKACIDIGLDCSYGDRIKQTRGPQYVAHLEKRLKLLESGNEHHKALESWKHAEGNVLADRPTIDSGSSRPDRHTSSPSDSGSSALVEPTQPCVSKIRTADLQFEPPNQQLKRESFDSAIDMSSPRKRTASDILIDAKDVLDGLSPTNQIAGYAAECIELLSYNLYQDTPVTQLLPEFTLFGPNHHDMTDVKPTFDPLDSIQFPIKPYIDPTQTFAAHNNQLWSSSNYIDFFPAAPAS